MVDLLRSDGSIIINKNLIFSLGTNSAIVYSELLSRFIYFLGKDQLTEDGYFYNTIDDLRLGTGLGRTAQTNAINKLKDKGLIKKDLRGLPPKRHFKIIPDGNLLAKFLEEGRKEIEKLKEKLDENADISKIGYSKRLKEYIANETNSMQQTRNNTNVNNTKHNKQALPVETVSKLTNLLNRSIKKNEIDNLIDYKVKYIDKAIKRIEKRNINIKSTNYLIPIIEDIKEEEKKMECTVDDDEIEEYINSLG